MASPKAIAAISALFKKTLGRFIEPDELEGWRIALEPIPDELAWEAALRVVRETTRRFDVAPGAVYAKAKEMITEQLPSPGEAWFMARAVACGELEMNNLEPAVQGAIDQIGLRAIRNMDVTDMGTRAHFIRFYSRLLEKQVSVKLEALGSGERVPVLAKQLEALR